MDKMGNWSKGYIGALIKSGLMSGYPDGSFKAKELFKRGEAISALNNALYKDSKVYSKAGTYGPAVKSEVVDSTVIIKADGVVLQNLVIKGNLVITKEVGDGDVTLNNVIVSGSTIVRGGGLNSIHINGGSYNKIIVQKTATGEVRIVAKDVNGLEVILSENASGEDIVLEGSFEEVIIEASDIDIKTQGKTSIEKFTVEKESQNTNIELDASTRVKSMVFDAPADVVGKGVIEKAEVNSDNVTYEVKPLESVVDKAVKVQPLVVGEAITEVEEIPAAPGGNPGGNSGGTSGGNSGGNPGGTVVLPVQTGSPAFVSNQPMVFDLNVKVVQGTLSIKTNVTYKWYKSVDTNFDATLDTLLGEGDNYTPKQGDIGKYLIVVVSTPDATGLGILVSGAVVLKAENTTNPMLPIKDTNHQVTSTTIVLQSDIGHEYAIKSINGVDKAENNYTWQASATFNGLAANTTYSFVARIAETPTHLASVISSKSNDIKTKAVQSGAPTFKSGTPIRFGTKVEINEGSLSTKTNVAYTWYRSHNNIFEQNSDTIIVEAGESYTPVKEDIGKYIIVIASTPDAEGIAQIVSDLVQKAENKNKPIAPKKDMNSDVTTSSITLEANTSCEFAISKIADQAVSTLEWQISPIFGDLNPNTEYTFVARFKETDTQLSSVQSLGSQVVRTLGITSEPGDLYVYCFPGKDNYGHVNTESKINLWYYIDTPLDNGNVVIHFPDEIKISADDYVGFNANRIGSTMIETDTISNTNYAIISDEGRTLTLSGINTDMYSEFLVTINTKQFGHVSDFNFSAQNDRDGMKGDYEISMGVGIETDVLKIVDEPISSSGYINVFNNQGGEKVAIVNSSGNIHINYSSYGQYNDGTVTFVLPDEFTVGEDDYILIDHGAPFSTSPSIIYINENNELIDISTDKHSVTLNNVNTEDNLALTLTLYEKSYNTIGNYEFKAYSDQDGAGPKFVADIDNINETCIVEVLEPRLIKGKITFPNDESWIKSTDHIYFEAFDSSNGNRADSVINLEKGKYTYDYELKVLPGTYTLQFYSRCGNETYKAYYDEPVSTLNIDEATHVFIDNNDITDKNVTLIKVDSDSTSLPSLSVYNANGGENEAPIGVENNIQLNYSAQGVFKEGSVTFNLPEAFKFTENDQVNLDTRITTSATPLYLFEEGVDYSISDDQQSLTLYNLNSEESINVCVDLSGRQYTDSGVYEYFAYSDFDGVEQKYEPTSGSGSESVSIVAREGMDISFTISLPEDVPLANRSITGIVHAYSEQYDKTMYVNYEIPSGSRSTTVSTKILEDTYKMEAWCFYDNKFYQSYFTNNGCTIEEAAAEAVILDSEGNNHFDITLLVKEVYNPQEPNVRESYLSLGTSRGNGTTGVINAPTEISLYYSSKEIYTNGKVVFHLPEHFEVTETDWLGINLFAKTVNSWSSVRVAEYGDNVQISDEGRTITISNITSTEPIIISLTLSDRIVLTESSYIFSVSEDPDGEGSVYDLSTGPSLTGSKEFVEGTTISGLLNIKSDVTEGAPIYLSLYSPTKPMWAYENFYYFSADNINQFPLDIAVLKGKYYLSLNILINGVSKQYFYSETGLVEDEANATLINVSDSSKSDLIIDIDLDQLQ